MLVVTLILQKESRDIRKEVVNTPNANCLLKLLLILFLIINIWPINSKNTLSLVQAEHLCLRGFCVKGKAMKMLYGNSIKRIVPIL